jgi:hypothetical protein
MAITTTNSGRIVPPGTALPEGITSLEDTIILGTDGGRFKIKGSAEPVEAVWKVISGTDILKIPSDAVRNMTLTGVNTFAQDTAGNLHLFVQMGSSDFDDLMQSIEDAGIGLAGDKASFAAVVNENEAIRTRVPDLYNPAKFSRIPRDRGMALLEAMQQQLKHKPADGLGL